MKFKHPYNNERRIITYFALLPIRIRNETRWFERVTIEQEYWGTTEKWHAIKFIDEDDTDE